MKVDEYIRKNSHEAYVEASKFENFVLKDIVAVTPFSVLNKVVYNGNPQENDG
jgi:hypothetical protein